MKSQAGIGENTYKDEEINRKSPGTKFYGSRLTSTKVQRKKSSAYHSNQIKIPRGRNLISLMTPVIILKLTGQLVFFSKDINDGLFYEHLLCPDLLLVSPTGQMSVSVVNRLHR